MPLPLTIGGESIIFSCRPSVRCPSVNTHVYFAICLDVVKGFQ